MEVKKFNNAGKMEMHKLRGMFGFCDSCSFVGFVKIIGVLGRKNTTRGT